jgi:hypothetical protein
MKPAKIASGIIILTSTVCLGIFLWWHWKLGLVRYFDVDEYAHLHWAAQMIMGKKPYVDFLSFFPPGFAWFLMPAILLGWGTVQPFITARVFTFLIFAGMCLMAALIFKHLRKNLWGSIAAAMFLAFLPLPFDKYLEVRPDNLATLIILIAVYFQMKWMSEGKSKMALVSGFFYSLSYLVLPKMVPNILVGIGIAFLYLLQNNKWKTAKDRQNLFLAAKPFLIGIGLPAVLFILWALTLGNFGMFVYSLTSLQFESNKISQWFIMMPTLFFYPNGVFYGLDGWSRQLLSNHIVWLIGLGFAIYRLVTPYLSPGGKKLILSEILMAASCLVQVIFYVKIAPLKHTQYLIPIGVFVGFYMADFCLAIYHWVGGWKWGKAVYAGVYLFGAILLVNIFIEGNRVKQFWTNNQPLADIQAIYKKVPFTEPVLDLDGRMLYNPDPYYACCIPFGQFAGFLSRPLPNLPDYLAKNNVKYINQGELERVKTLPNDWQSYIFSHYRSDNGNKAFLIRNDVN